MSKSTHFEVEWRLTERTDDRWLPAGTGRFDTYMQAYESLRQVVSEADPGVLQAHVVEVTRSWSEVYADSTRLLPVR